MQCSQPPLSSLILNIIDTNCFLYKTIKRYSYWWATYRTHNLRLKRPPRWSVYSSLGIIACKLILIKKVEIPISLSFIFLVWYAHSSLSGYSIRRAINEVIIFWYFYLLLWTLKTDILLGNWPTEVVIMWTHLKLDLF